MSDARRIDMLRAKYRSLWDAHQILADRNARLANSGQQPSNEQLINEQRAAEAVQLARDELRAAISGN
jgi:predicted metal-dependent hydrolase